MKYQKEIRKQFHLQQNQKRIKYLGVNPPKEIKKKKKKKTYTNEVILMIINPTHSLLLRGILFI